MVPSPSLRPLANLPSYLKLINYDSICHLQTGLIATMLNVAKYAGKTFDVPIANVLMTVLIATISQPEILPTLCQTFA